MSRLRSTLDAERKQGFSLVEVLLSMSILGFVLAIIFQCVPTSISYENWLQNQDRMLYGKQYWFNRLEEMCIAADVTNLDKLKNVLKQMPCSLSDGSAHFSWSDPKHVGEGSGIVEITLSVSVSQNAGGVMQVRRKLVLLK